MFLTFIHLVACISASFIDESYTNTRVCHSLVKSLRKADYYKIHTARQDSSDKFLLDHIFQRNKNYHLISIEAKQKYTRV